MPLFINDCVIHAITTKAEKLSSTSVSNNKVPRIDGRFNWSKRLLQLLPPI